LQQAPIAIFYFSVSSLPQENLLFLIPLNFSRLIHTQHLEEEFMTQPDPISLAKKKCGREAIKFIEDGMILGLGSGSTVLAFLEALVDCIHTQKLKIYGVPTSYDTMFVARDYGLSLLSLQEIDRVDLAIDGADEVDPQLNVIKGAGGAFTWEKLVAMNATQFLVLIDYRKKSTMLGQNASVPVEVIPLALRQVTNTLSQMGAHPTLRTGSGKLGPVITDFGNFIIDAKFERIPDPHRLEQELNHIPGVVENGIFATKPPRVLVGYPEKVETLKKKSI